MPKNHPATAPALWPAFLLTSTLLLTGCSLFPSKSSSLDANAKVEPSGPPSFTLEVQASDKDVRELLTQHMELQRFRTLPNLQRRELSRLLNAAESNVRDLLGTLGYFAPTIRIELQNNTDPDTKTPSHVLVTVDPGVATKIETAAITFSGLSAHDPGGAEQRGRIQKNWSLKPGDTFSQSAWSSAKNAGLRTLQEKRYPTARIADSLADIDADTQLAELSVDYEPGSAYTLGPMKVVGSERYDPDGPRRIARLPVGAEYSQADLLDAQQRLASSGYYDSVFLTLDTSQAQSGEETVAAPVIANIREAKLQKWVLGVGVSTDTGFRLSADHIHNQLPWIGWRAVTKLNADQKNPSLSTEWTAMPDEGGWRWFTGAKAERASTGDFETNSLRVRAGRSQLGKTIDRNYYLQYDLASAQGIGAPPSSSAITANYGWTGRYFNSPTSPTAGYGFAWETGAGYTLTPQRDPFVRGTARWLYFMGLGDGARSGRLAFRAQGGAVVAKDSADIPITQLFLSGGDTTVRGYGYQQIGARTENDHIYGGRYLAIGSLEWQRPILLDNKPSDWEQTVFIDAGSVADRPGDMSVKVGVGTGVRWRSPVGPVQADLAYGVQPKRFRLHLRLGFNF